jgi:hypothetical protein
MILHVRMVVKVNIHLPVDKFMTFNNGVFYLASHSDIRALSIDEGSISPGVVHFDESSVWLIETGGSRIFGLYVNLRSFTGKNRSILVAIENN